MKKLTPFLLGLALVACRSNSMESEVGDETMPAVPAALVDDDDGEEEDEVEIGLDEVPEHVRAAAQAAVPGIVLEEAVKETEDGVTVYELEGELDGEDYEIEVAPDGTVLEIEQEGGDDDDDDGDDDDD